jgi:gamma-glutamylaminecyclotransferase
MGTSREPPRLVFVYGTLLPGETWHAALTGARRVGPGRTLPAFELLDLGPFPGLVHGGATAVEGEVYAVDAVHLDALDALKGHPEFYRRTAIVLEDGRQAFAYLLTPQRRLPSMRVITGGNWKKRKESARPRAARKQAQGLASLAGAP